MQSTLDGGYNPGLSVLSDDDTQTFKFNGQELYTGSWTAEQTDGSPLSLNALDLFSNGGTTVYWDDIKIVEITD